MLSPFSDERVVDRRGQEEKERNGWGRNDHYVEQNKEKFIYFIYLSLSLTLCVCITYIVTLIFQVYNFYNLKQVSINSMK